MGEILLWLQDPKTITVLLGIGAAILKVVQEYNKTKSKDMLIGIAIEEAIKLFHSTMSNADKKEHVVTTLKKQKEAQPFDDQDLEDFAEIAYRNRVLKGIK